MNIETITMLVTEEADCCAPGGTSVNEIEITTEDGGGGHYAVIKTQRWAIDLDKPEEFMCLIRKAIESCGGVKP